MYRLKSLSRPVRSDQAPFNQELGLVSRMEKELRLITPYLELAAEDDKYNPDCLNFRTELLLDVKIIDPIIRINRT